jgi:hypothetical protein
MYLTLVEYSPSQVDSTTPPPHGHLPHFPMNFNRKMREDIGGGLRQLLFDRQFDGFDAAVDTELVEDV